MTRRSAWLAVLLLATTTGCAELAASRARQQKLQQDLARYEYQQPMDEVWQAIRTLLAGLDLDLAGADAAAVGQSPSGFARAFSIARETTVSADGSRMLETAWSNGGVRYRAVALQAAGGVRVVLTRIKANETDYGHDGPSEVDTALELVLMRQLAPEAAAAIEAGSAPPAKAKAPAPAPEKPSPPPAPAPRRPPSIPNTEET